MGIVILIFVVGIAFTINLVVALKFEKIAFAKGYDTSIHSFAMCFWLGIVGYLYVIALPNKKEFSRSVSEALQCTTEGNKTNETGAENTVKRTGYECSKIVVRDMHKSGICTICRNESQDLKFCKIKSEIGTREMFICDECIKLFKSNETDSI